MEPSERTSGRRRDERTDAAIIAAVLDLIADGATLSGLSLVTIASVAGVSRNSVYRRWKTKDDLYLDVLASINRALPDLAGDNVTDDLSALLTVLIERTMDARANRILRALNAEAALFPELHRRYFDEIVEPRRAAMRQVLQRGVEAGEIRDDLDVTFTAGILVAPILARMASGDTDDLDPVKTGQQITDLVFTGIKARPSSASDPHPLNPVATALNSVATGTAPASTSEMPSSPPEKLELPHGLLVRLREEHADRMSQAVLASLDHLKPWMPWASAEAGSPAAQLERCKLMQDSWASGADYTYALLPDEAGPIIGSFGMHRRIGPGGIEVGYWMHVDYVGQGYATAAAQVLTEAGLALDDVTRVEIHTDQANVKSAAIPQRLGFRLDRVDTREPEAPAECGRIQIWVTTGQ